MSMLCGSADQKHRCHVSVHLINWEANALTDTQLPQPTWFIFKYESRILLLILNFQNRLRDQKNEFSHQGAVLSHICLKEHIHTAHKSAVVFMTSYAMMMLTVQIWVLSPAPCYFSIKWILKFKQSNCHMYPVLWAVSDFSVSCLCFVVLLVPLILLDRGSVYLNPQLCTSFEYCKKKKTL